MVDTECLHGKLRHLCKYCNLQYSEILFNYMGAHLGEPPATNNSTEIEVSREYDSQRGMAALGIREIREDALY
jgi:hypothetical protein